MMFSLNMELVFLDRWLLFINLAAYPLDCAQGCFN